MQNLEALINRQIHRWNDIVHTLAYQPGDKGESRPRPPGSVRHPAICISRDLGAGARAVAGLVCDRIGYELYGTQLIDELARDLKVQRQLVDSMDEATHGALEMMMDGLLRGEAVDQSDYFRSLLRVVGAFGIQGGVVILGRGGSFVLGEKAALRVLVTASEPVRIRRVMSYQGIGEAEARALVHKFDHDRAAFVRLHFKADLRDPANYDLCINTDRLSAPEAAGLIFSAIERRGFPVDSLRLPEPAATEA